MDNKFKAIVLNQSGDQFTREIKTLEKSFFKTGNVMVKVDYSSLNYKDGLILKNGGKLVKKYPNINFFVDPIPHDAGTSLGSASSIACVSPDGLVEEGTIAS